MSSLKTPVIGIIANSTSPSNRLDLIKELGEPRNGFFGPLKFSFGDLSGEIIALDIQPNEILEISGMTKAKRGMFGALEYLSGRGIKVNCFTASTKRLPGRSGREVKELYPDITFSIGDNATMVSYLAILDHFLSDPGFDKKNDEIVCLGAGFLGLKSVEHMLQNACEKITIVSEQKLVNLPQTITVLDSPQKLPENIKIFMSCSHKYQLDPLTFGKKLAPNAIIVDVAVPPGINREIYNSLPKTVSRFDAGDFFLADIKYDFPPKILSFPTVGFWYGCFSEAVMLAIARESGKNLQEYNFFEVNQMNSDLISYYLHQQIVSVPLINFFAPDKAITFIPF